MEKLIARSYIEKRIQKTRTRGVDIAASVLSGLSVYSEEENALSSARVGFPEMTATHLSRSYLPISIQGLILAEAFNKNAELREFKARKNSKYDKDAIKAPQLRRVAQNLTRAVKRVL